MTPSQTAAATRRTSDRAAGHARTRRFDDSLQAARRTTAQKAAGSEHPPPAAAARRKVPDRKGELPRDQRDPLHHHAPPESAPVGPRPALAAPPPEVTVPELRALVRTLPLAVGAPVHEGAPLALEVGRALSVELRRRPDGVEVLLRPDASFSRAIAAELPALIRALRARGLTVARAEVRARADAGSPAPGTAR